MNSRLRNIDNYAKINDTWTSASSLHTSSFSPFKSIGNWRQNTAENYSNNYNTITTGWTVAGNITPGNSSVNFLGDVNPDSGNCNDVYYSY